MKKRMRKVPVEIRNFAHETMVLVYKTDTWHTQESRELIGVCSNINSGINICHQRAKKEKHQITSQQHELLDSIRQTQGYEGTGEFYMEEQPINILI
jgi:hypothetical protein